MSVYQAPAADMEFVINEVVGLESTQALPGHEDVNAELVSSIIEEAGKFATGILDPLNWPGDREGAKLEDHVVTPATGFTGAYKKFSEGGWGGLSNDPDWGGQGLPHIISALTSEMWHAACTSFALCPMLTAGAVQAVKRHGSDELKEIFLSKLISGEWSGTMNLTEPQAGSDLSAVRAKAIPEGDHYRIYGTKIYITWGEHTMADNIIHLVLARTPDAPEGVKGISLFVVPKYLVNSDGSIGERNDVKCVSIEEKLGIHASPTCVMAFGDGEGATGYLVGAENRGLQYMFTMMNFARLEVGIEGLALAERSYQRAAEFAKGRIQGRSLGQGSGERVSIIHHPDVRRMLLTMKSQVEAMRSIVLQTCSYLDQALTHESEEERARYQRMFDLLTPVVKGWCTEQSIEITSLGVQVHGGMGFVEETGAAQYLRDARITPIYEGTTGIQANDLIGRKVATERGLTALELISMMRETIKDLGKYEGHSGLTKIKEQLNEAVASLEHSVKWVVDTYMDDPETASAGSVPLLKLFGTVAGGWMLARSAIIAKKRLDEGGDNAKFYRGKLATCRFYAENILPLATVLNGQVVGGHKTIVALDESYF